MLTIAVLSLLIPVFWLLMQEYLRLSDVYKMYGNASMQPHSSSPAALHCLSLAVAPALPCEVDTLPALWHVSLTCTKYWTHLNTLTVNTCHIGAAFWRSFPLSSLFPVLQMCCFCVYLYWLVVCAQEYITVSQLSQIFGMQRVDPSSSSSIPSFQLASSESAFSCHSAAYSSSSFLSAQVCYSFLIGGVPFW